MKNTYKDLISQTYEFPQSDFRLNGDFLEFNGIDLKTLIDKYGTPLRLMYLPKIREQISDARSWFGSAMTELQYQAKYKYSYCTKCCHFSHVIEAALLEGVQLETSSSFDIDLIFRLYNDGKLDQSTILIHNGYKTDNYLKKIIQLHEAGFENSVVVLDSLSELGRLKSMRSDPKMKLMLGIRMAVEQEPQSAYYTSRLGIPPSKIMDLYEQEIEEDESVELRMLHFFVDSGIKDNLFYWGEFQKAVKIFIALKKACNTLDAFNLGGGFPIKNNLNFEYDYASIVHQIVKNLADSCRAENVKEPDIYTEFGKYTVGECGATLFSIVEQKAQNDSELWYMIDNSLMNTIPDTWSIFEKFILLPINKWSNEYRRVNIGGLSCDQYDYYNSEDLNQQLMLPVFQDGKEPLYIGFFHTGAYQDAISGYGGIKHCLIPSPKYVVVDLDEEGKMVDWVFQEEQNVEAMLDILGYNREKGSSSKLNK